MLWERIAVRSAVQGRHLLLRSSLPLPGPSCTPRRVTSRPFATTPPPTPNQFPRHKRVVRIVVAFLAGACFYFVLPDPTKAAPTYNYGPLSPKYFTPVTVIENEDSGPDTKLLRLAIKPEVKAASDPNGFKAIWSVFIKDDDIQVERPYTPLHGIDEHGHMLLWIKKYPKGEVGRWLHSKVPGDKIEIRGPLTTWGWKDEEWDEVVMISGGTGFTPFYQLFDSIISKETVSPSTKFTLLHSSRTPEDLPPPSLLKPLLQFAKDHPERLKVDLFVDVNENKSSEYDLSVTRINEKSLKTSLGLSTESGSWLKGLVGGKTPEPAPKRRMFLVCGPDPMVAAIAGPFGRNMSQGQLGGILSKLGYTSQDVYKL